MEPRRMVSRRMLVLSSVTGGAALLVAVTAAFGTDFLEDARKLAVDATASRQRISLISRMPPPSAPVADPRVVGGTFELINPTTGESATFNLPAEGWSGNDAGTLLRFRNPDAPGGLSEVKLVNIRDGREVKLTARAAGITLDEAAQGTLGTILTIGSDRYCTTCSISRRDEPGHYSARRCGPPIACPSGAGSTSTTSPPTTSTSASTSTSTSASTSSSTSSSSSTIGT